MISPQSSFCSTQIDVEQTFTSKRLETPNFSTSLATHGIDIIADPADDKSIYIYAVNHQPNPGYLHKYTSIQNSTEKAASQIEVFHHVLGSPRANHIRTISHHLIRTPNDILAASPDRLYITNDHYRREGHLRDIEDLVSAATWSDVVRVDGPLTSKSGDIQVKVALQGVHNPNGLGHRADQSILMTSAASGQLYLVDAFPDAIPGEMLKISETLAIDSSVDNPSYFEDKYATPADDKSGIVLAGLSRAIDVMKLKTDITTPLSVMVWHVAKNEKGEWVKRVLFEDDGSRISGAATAVMLPIDPAKEGGKKKAWLWITGFLSASMVAVKVDL